VSGRLLIPEPPLQVLPSLAKELANLSRCLIKERQKLPQRQMLLRRLKATEKLELLGELLQLLSCR
jgi:hypothetical protein